MESPNWQNLGSRPVHSPIRTRMSRSRTESIVSVKTVNPVGVHHNRIVSLRYFEAVYVVARATGSSVRPHQVMRDIDLVRGY
jgi:hypothetical protein